MTREERLDNMIRPGWWAGLTNIKALVLEFVEQEIKESEAQTAALGPRMRAYLALERAMVDLDEAGDPVGAELRDRMDRIWLQLSDDEHKALDRREGEPSVFAGTVGLPTTQEGR